MFVKLDSDIGVTRGGCEILVTGGGFSSDRPSIGSVGPLPQPDAKPMESSPKMMRNFMADPFRSPLSLREAPVISLKRNF
jgi:hypothetical protein